MFCEKCGTKNENSASFCKECGAPPTTGRAGPFLGSPLGKRNFLEVTEAQKVWVSVTVSGAEHENMTRMSAKAIRIGDFWYMYAGSMYTPGLFGS